MKKTNKLPELYSYLIKVVTAKPKPSKPTTLDRIELSDAIYREEIEPAKDSTTKPPGQ